MHNFGAIISCVLIGKCRHFKSLVVGNALQAWVDWVKTWILYVNIQNNPRNDALPKAIHRQLTDTTETITHVGSPPGATAHRSHGFPPESYDLFVYWCCGTDSFNTDFHSANSSIVDAKIRNSRCSCMNWVIILRSSPYLNSRCPLTRSTPTGSRVKIKGVAFKKMINFTSMFRTHAIVLVVEGGFNNNPINPKRECACIQHFAQAWKVSPLSLNNLSHVIPRFADVI